MVKMQYLPGTITFIQTLRTVKVIRFSLTGAIPSVIFGLQATGRAKAWHTQGHHCRSEVIDHFCIVAVEKWLNSLTYFYSADCDKASLDQPGFSLGLKFIMLLKQEL
jgi:hypothetical protein